MKERDEKIMKTNTYNIHTKILINLFSVWYFWSNWHFICECGAIYLVFLFQYLNCSCNKMSNYYGIRMQTVFVLNGLVCARVIIHTNIYTFNSQVPTQISIDCFANRIYAYFAGSVCKYFGRILFLIQKENYHTHRTIFKSIFVIYFLFVSQILF